MKNEMLDFVDMRIEEYIKSNYPSVSLS
jgi:hypothetical protein